MVPENEFHHKEQPVRSATPASLQNGPGSAGKPAPAAPSAGKPEEGASEDAGEGPGTANGAGEEGRWGGPGAVNGVWEGPRGRERGLGGAQGP